jgi:hypothetical protein
MVSFISSFAFSNSLFLLSWNFLSVSCTFWLTSCWSFCRPCDRSSVSSPVHGQSPLVFSLSPSFPPFLSLSLLASLPACLPSFLVLACDYFIKTQSINPYNSLAKVSNVVNLQCSQSPRDHHSPVFLKPPNRCSYPCPTSPLGAPMSRSLL